MQTWQSLEHVFTVESIMTPYDEKLLVWDRQESLVSVWAKADQYKIDTIPVADGKLINAVLERNSDEPLALTYDWTVTRDTSIPMIVKVFHESDKQCLFVMSGQNMIGLVTPADLNRLTSRTYFYTLIAELESRIANHIRDHFDDDEQIWSLIDNAEKQETMQKKLSVSSLELNVVHTLLLSDMVNIIKKDERLRDRLGFSSNKKVGNTLSGLVHFRNDIMHPVSPILSDTVGIDTLHGRIQRIFELLERI